MRDSIISHITSVNSDLKAVESLVAKGFVTPVSDFKAAGNSNTASNLVQKLLNISNEIKNFNVARLKMREEAKKAESEVVALDAQCSSVKKSISTFLNTKIKELELELVEIRKKSEEYKSKVSTLDDESLDFRLQIGRIESEQLNLKNQKSELNPTMMLKKKDLLVKLEELKSEKSQILLDYSKFNNKKNLEAEKLSNLLSEAQELELKKSQILLEQEQSELNKSIDSFGFEIKGLSGKLQELESKKSQILLEQSNLKSEESKLKERNASFMLQIKKLAKYLESCISLQKRLASIELSVPHTNATLNGMFRILTEGSIPEFQNKYALKHKKIIELRAKVEDLNKSINLSKGGLKTNNKTNKKKSRNPTARLELEHTRVSKNLKSLEDELKALEQQFASTVKKD